MQTFIKIGLGMLIAGLATGCTFNSPIVAFQHNQQTGPGSQVNQTGLFNTSQPVSPAANNTTNIIANQNSNTEETPASTIPEPGKSAGSVSGKNSSEDDIWKKAPSLSGNSDWSVYPTAD